MTLIFLVASTQAEYLGGEAVLLKLTLTNTGTNALRVPAPDSPANWQPVYVIEGPGLAQPLEVDLRRGPHAPASGAALPEPPESEAETVEIQPGQSWEGVLEFENLLRELREGEYHVRAVLTWGGETVRSDRASFRIGKLRLAGLSRGIWGDPPGSSLSLLALHRGNGQPVLLSQSFRMARREAAVPKTAGAFRIEGVGASARDPIAATSDHDLDSDLFSWAFWREDGKLLGRSSRMSWNIAFNLPEDAGDALSPALMDYTHEADVFVAAGGGNGARRLLIVRFLDPLQTGRNEARLVAALPLPGASFQFGSAFTMESASRRRQIALVTIQNGALMLHHAGYDPDTAPKAFQAYPIEATEKVEAIPDSPPAVWAGRDGSVRIGVMVRLESDKKHCLLVELPLDPQGEAGEPVLTPVVLPAPAVAVGLAYYQPEPGPRETVWAAWSADGTVFAPGPDGVRVARQQWPADQPRVLVVLRGNRYLLKGDPVRGFALDLL